MRQLQKIFITMALLTSGAAHADCSKLAGNYTCAFQSLEILIEEQGAAYDFTMKQGEYKMMTLTVDGTDRIEPIMNRKYNASCNNDRLIMTSSASDGTDPQTMEAYSLKDETSEDVMYVSMTALDEAGEEQTMTFPLCTRQ